LPARPIYVRGLAADISDQTCKTAPQSRTRFVGHRQLPWIQLKRSCFTSFWRSRRRQARVKDANQKTPVANKSFGQISLFEHDPENRFPLFRIML
jgi:hypothetical protein